MTRRPQGDQFSRVTQMSMHDNYPVTKPGDQWYRNVQRAKGTASTNWIGCEPLIRGMQALLTLKSWPDGKRARVPNSRKRRTRGDDTGWCWLDRAEEKFRCSWRWTENQRASVAYRERAINLPAIRDRAAALAAPERSGDVTKATICHAGSLSLTLIERGQLRVLSNFPSVLREVAEEFSRGGRGAGTVATFILSGWIHDRARSTCGARPPVAGLPICARVCSLGRVNGCDTRSSSVCVTMYYELNNVMIGTAPGQRRISCEPCNGCLWRR